MNARKFLNVRVSLTVTALALSAALVISASCAGGGGTGGSGGGGAGGGGAGGGASPCDSVPSDTVAFCQGSAKGLMTGAGWVALGASDTISDPTCGSDAITKAKACSSTTTWNKQDQLCMSGTVPALSGSPTKDEYTANWGVQIGVNSTEPNDTVFDASSYTLVTFNVTGLPSKNLRAMIHRKGDDDLTTYCASFSSGTPVTITAFNTKCWGESGTVLFTDSDKKNIDKIGVQVSSAVGTAVTVDNFCLTSVVFGN